VKTRHWMRMFSEELVFSLTLFNIFFIQDPGINIKFLLEKIVGDRWEEWQITARQRLTLERHITKQPGIIGMAKLCTSNKDFMRPAPSLLLPKGGLKSPDAKRLCGQYWKITSMWNDTMAKKVLEFSYRKATRGWIKQC